MESRAADPRHTRIREVLPFFLFFAIALLTRFHTFFLSVVDWDETTYALVARGILHGFFPYTWIWDNKPPGLYAIFALFQFLTGDSVLSIRFLTVFFTAGNTFLIYRISRLYWNDLRGPLAAGFYLACSLTNGGLAANSEHVFLFFSLLGIWWCLSRHLHRWGAIPSMAFAGLSLGIAFQIKYFALTDAAAGLVGFFLLRPQSDRCTPGNDRNDWKNLFLALAAFLVPSVGTMVLFAVAGLWDPYVYANFTANAIRAALVPWQWSSLSGALVRQFLLHPVLWLSLLAGLIAVRPRQGVQSRFRTFCVVWVLIDLLAVLTTRAYYPHYFLPVLAPLSLLAADGLLRLDGWGARFGRGRLWLRSCMALAVVLSVGLAIVSSFRFSVEYTVERIPNPPWQYWDTPAEAATYIRGHGPPGSSVYVADYHHVIYFLLNVPPPTRYAAPPFIIGFEELDRVAGIDGIAELQRIMNAPPRFVVTARYYNLGRPEYYRALDGYLRRMYYLETHIGPVEIFHLRREFQPNTPTQHSHPEEQTSGEIESTGSQNSSGGEP